MKCLVVLVPSVLGACALLFAPGIEACGPRKLHCPVAGLGKDVQPVCCPKTPMTYWSKKYCTYQTTQGSRHSLAYKGGKIYFCCEACVPIFQKSPGKFAANANLQLYASRQAKQVRCPLCGEELKTPEEVEIGGVHVDVCGAACKKKVDEVKPLERLHLVFGEAAFGKAFVMQTKTTAPAQKSTTAPALIATEPGCCCQQQAGTPNRGRSE